jgi:membrane protein DedA with SNARE-associated domain
VTNIQVRLPASSIALIAGALAASTDNLDVNVGLLIIIVSAAHFVADYIRCQRQ